VQLAADGFADERAVERIDVADPAKMVDLLAHAQSIETSPAGSGSGT
jgi:hypothetical protein